MSSAFRWRRRLLWTGAVVVLLIVLYWTRDSLLSTAGRLLDQSDPPGTTDYVLVLGGGNETRPFVAAALMKAGYAHVVLLTKVKISTAVKEGLVPPSHEVARRILLLRKVPAERIRLLPEECATTYDESKSLKLFLEAEPAATVTVVTTDFHTRRTRWVFGRVLGSRISQVRFLAAPAIGFNADDWWHSEDGVQTYLDEFGKLGFYFVYYNPLWCAAVSGIILLSYGVYRHVSRRTTNPIAIDKPTT